MRCPYCGVDRDRVIKTRREIRGDADVVLRWRRCRACGRGWRTEEGLVERGRERAVGLSEEIEGAEEGVEDRAEE